jgi:hypothetical protein
MRATVGFAAVAVLIAGCSWKLERNDWLPLVGGAPSLAEAPRATSGPEALLYQASDGRVWIKTRDASASMGGLIMRSLDLTAEEHHFPMHAWLADAGVVLLEPLATSDSARARVRVTLDRLGAGPTVTREMDVGDGFTPTVVRGPGFFVVAPGASPAGDGAGSPAGANAAPIAILSDDGSDDEIPADAAGWSVSAAPAEPPASVELTFEGSARFILLHATADESLGAYDRTTHTLLRLGVPPQPVPMPMQMPSSHFAPPPRYIYDDAHERVWFCGVETATVSLLTGATLRLPFACIDIHQQRGADLLAQAPDGTVYALAADGSAATALGKFPAYGIRYARGRSFLYVRSPQDENGDTFSGWIGDKNLVRVGMSPRFSADGKRLYWLEDVALRAGDLWSYDLASGAARHLVRNVTQFDELPDGRLIAIANAAIDGAFNRAIVVDERVGETRWIAADAQLLWRAGDAVVVERVSGAMFDFFLVSPPPPPR